MNAPLPLFQRLVVMLENFNKSQRAIVVRSPSAQRTDGAAPTRGALTAIALGGANSLARSRQLSQKNLRSWHHKARLHGDVAQTPSNLM